MTTERLAVWPGPMHVNRVIKEDRLYVSDAQGHRLAEVWGGINEDTDALARLFAAALEMYAALNGLGGLLADVEHEPELDAEIMRAIYMARSAIAKAEGNS